MSGRLDVQHGNIELAVTGKFQRFSWP